MTGFPSVASLDRTNDGADENAEPGSTPGTDAGAVAFASVIVDFVADDGEELPDSVVEPVAEQPVRARTVRMVASVTARMSFPL
ncbi:hypothetical protein GCM10028781_11680 [Nostocoides australiense]